MALTDKLTAIANAIRSKTGGSDLLTLDEMPQEIQSIQTGGGGDADTALADSIIDSTATTYTSDTLEIVAKYAMRDRDSLTSFSSTSLKEVKEYGFYSCNKLSTLIVPNLLYIRDYGFYMCPQLKNVVLPKATTIGGYAFQDGGLVSLDLGACTQISSYGAFNGTDLDTLIIRTNTICSLAATSNISGTPIADGTGYIYVPQTLLEQYKVATNWATYANQFRAIEDYPEFCGGES